MIDGKGGVIDNGVITIQGTKITAVGPATAGQTYTYDLGTATALPGMIDVHVHLNWYFGPSGKYGEQNVPADYVAQAIQDNARVTLMAGFTTVQSVGWNNDPQLRAAIAAGLITGPRIADVRLADPGRQRTRRISCATACARPRRRAPT